MKQERWQTVEKLYHSAFELPVSDRAPFLREACSQDPGLLEEVESLLRHSSIPQSVLDTPAIDLLAKAVATEEGDFPASVLEGKTISHYRVIECIGKGGMGVVYKAEDMKLQRNVALKLLPRFLASDREALNRFEREAQAASALNHPNICTVYEVDEAQGLHFIAIELLDGETLKQRIARGPVEILEILGIGVSICDALQTAHSAGIIHRDIKPSNIVLTRRGMVKLLDFGVAKQVRPETTQLCEMVSNWPTLGQPAHLTQAGAVVGTVEYMSPEQARGEDVDARSDLFSLATVLYELTTGKCPFSGADEADVLQAIDRRSPIAVEKLKPKAPAGFVGIIEKALHKDRSQRYSSAAEMQQDLERLRRSLNARIDKQKTRLALCVVTGLFVLLVWGSLWIAPVRRRMFGNSSAEERREVKSLAVLPLANLTGDPSQEYFVDGMTDALIADLTKVSSLRVISRTSAMHYKGTHKTIPEVARELNVNAVLEGSVVRSGSQVRISTQLADAISGQNIWGGEYQQDLQDVLQLQNQMATAIATEIAGKLNPQDIKKLNTARTANPEAYEAYLRGRHFLKQLDLTKSLKYFQEAIRIDPNYAPAYSGLADVYVALGVGTEADADKSYELALQAATKAISLDDSLAEAHASLAFVLHRFKQDWQGAEKEFKRALELDPNYAVGQKRYGVYLLTIGRRKAGCNHIRLAHSLDPISPDSAVWFATCLYESGHFNDAVQTLTVAIEMNPSDEAELRQGIGEIYERNEMYPESVAEYQKALELGGRSWMGLALLASGYASWGKRVEAEKVLAELRERFGDDDYVDAATYAVMGEREQAIRALVREGTCPGNRIEPGFSWLRIQWRFDSIRSDPRFKALERCANYPDPE
jgi:serine/threonine protein kinase/tetratricopeptide (TPR) repeat protein